MKNPLLIVFSFLLLTSSSPHETFDDGQDNWVSLFDGKSLAGWHRYNKPDTPTAWVVREGELTFDPTLVRQGDRGHDIVTDKEFSNFQLSLEWNIAEGGNSGVFWGVQELPEYGKPYLTGPEVQVLDNERHPDSKVNPNFHQAGALYDLVQPSEEVCLPAGSWNHFLITINYTTNEGSIELNGTKIVEFPLYGEEWDALVAGSKFNNPKGYKDFGKFRTGKIGLQDHGDVIAFRNIKIREL